jgi:chemotaxis protein MotB
MARRKKRHEEHTNHEAWAIPYGDLITLLLAFFVVMYALSSVNEGKFRLLSDSLYAEFRGTPRTIDPVQVGDQHQVGPGADSRTGIAQQQRHAGQDPAPPVTVPAVAPPAAEAAQPVDDSLGKVADQVENAMADMVRKNLVSVRRGPNFVEVEIRTDILFPSGSAQLAPNAVSVLQQLAQVLTPLPNAVRVEGHTDNVPIRNTAFYSNWELSAARAGSVVRVLASRGVDPKRLAVVGFGEHRPAQSNDTAQGRNANRRVIVVILSADAAHANDPLRMLPGPADIGGAASGTQPAVITAPGTAAEAPQAVAAPTPAPTSPPTTPAADAATSPAPLASPTGGG